MCITSTFKFAQFYYTLIGVTVKDQVVTNFEFKRTPYRYGDNYEQRTMLSTDPLNDNAIDLSPCFCHTCFAYHTHQGAPLSSRKFAFGHLVIKTERKSRVTEQLRQTIPDISARYIQNV